MISKKMITSYKLCLDNNDWHEIRKALPELAKRQIISGNTLSEKFQWSSFKSNLFLFLESLGISFAKKLRIAYEEGDFACPDDIVEDTVGFKDAINEIDNKVKDYIKSNSFKLKALDFRNKEDFEHWTDRFNKSKLVETLWKVISSNQDNPFVDKIISELEKY